MEFKEIITPTSSEYTVSIPEEMIGKKIEIVVNEVEESIDNLSKEERIAEIRKIFKDSLVDLSNFKFNRDEANNYDE